MQSEQIYKAMHIKQIHEEMQREQIYKEIYIEQM